MLLYLKHSFVNDNQAKTVFWPVYPTHIQPLNLFLLSCSNSCTIWQPS